VTLSRPQPLLTLEPLIEAVRAGAEAAGWTLSGLQKTTSHHFEGRWAGDSSRSAYLFFHLPSGPEWASLDVFLDETSEGLVGNLALVVDGCALERLGDPRSALATLGRIARSAVPAGHRAPVTLRLRLEDGDRPAGDAETEIRFKVGIPRAALQGGAEAVTALAVMALDAFLAMLADPALHPFLSE
jgi:hypothetical protein